MRTLNVISENLFLKWQPLVNRFPQQFTTFEEKCKVEADKMEKMIIC